MMHQVSCFTLKFFHVFVLHKTYKTIWRNHKATDFTSKMTATHYNLHGGVKLPDNANVWRPPAATEVIFTPGSSSTIQGGAERDSSAGGGLSSSCLAVTVLLLFVVSSAFLLSW